MLHQILFLGFLNQICTQINLADVITVPFQSRILFRMGIDCKNRVKVEATVIQSQFQRRQF